MKAIRWVLAGVVVTGVITGSWRQRANERLRAEAAARSAAVPADRVSDHGSRVSAGSEHDPVARIGPILRSLGEAAGSGDRKRAALLQGRVSKMLGDCDGMEAGKLVSLIESLADAEDLADDVRRRFVALAGAALAEKDPAALMNMISGNPGRFDASFVRRQVGAGALRDWASKAPEEALAWYQSNRALLPSDSEARSSLLAGAAVEDARTAFRILQRLGEGSPEEDVHAIMSAGTDDDEGRSGVLGALRGYLETIDDEGTRARTGSKALEILARGIDGEEFSTVSRWVESVRLTPAERASFASGLTWFGTGKETGRWVEWISGNVSGAEASGPVRELVAEWTQQDYRAAGEWLAAGKGMTPEVHAAAVAAYAGEVAEYDPQVAVQWALTLPEGQSRQATLRAVHENWPSSDSEGAAAFAREHKIE
jgi:hypothetical protein